MRVWLNDRLVEPGEAKVSVFDHGLTVGDGIFETCKIVNGIPFALTRHLVRLQASAAGLGLPRPDLHRVRHAVTAAIDDAGRPVDGRVRITYTSGAAPLGSRRSEAAAGLPTLVVVATGGRAWSPSAAVQVVPWPRNERGATAGLKTVSYAENVIALAYALERDAEEAIFANTAGELCEGAGSNVVVGIDGRLVTPPLSSGCLAGVTRALLIEWCDVVEAPLPVGVLAETEEVFLASSTRDVQPVHAVDGKPVPNAPGPLTQRAAETFATRSAGDLDP
jgi:branched-chain amino acid aminotransferase